MAIDSTASSHATEDVPCTGCSCLCDDLRIVVRQGQVTTAEHACELGRAWFCRPPDVAGAACLVRGNEADFLVAIHAAAELLSKARYPLVYGLADATCDAVRAAVALADRLGAVIDTPTSHTHGPTLTSFPTVGEVTCTLGEIRHRSNLLICWGVDPPATHPRFFERYAPPDRPRFRVLVGSRQAAMAQQADLVLELKPGADFAAFWTLRALVAGLELDAELIERQTGVGLAAWQALAQQMVTATYGAFLLGESHARTNPHLPIDALYTLLRDLNAHTRFVAVTLRSATNAAGADQVLTWQTGLPMAVNLALGYPRFGPGEYSAVEVLARGEADAALVVGSESLKSLTLPALEHLARIPHVLVADRPTPAFAAATVAIRTAVAGVHSPGTFHRLDDVALGLRPVLTSPHPHDFAVLAAIEQAVLRG